MKAALLTLGIGILAACSTAPEQTAAVKDDSAAVSLAGRTYSRTFTGTPLGSSVPVEYTHVIQFVDEWTVSDNGSTFFGNPPESGSYELSGSTITMTLRSITGNSYEQRYTLAADGLSITGEAGAVLRLESRIVTVEMEQAEIQDAIALFNRVDAPLVEENSICSYTTLDIVSQVRGFNPARWTAVADGVEHAMTADEIQAAIRLFNRVEVPAVSVDSITLRSKATIKSRVCGFNPATWTVSYEAK